MVKDIYSDFAKDYDQFGSISDIDQKEQAFINKVFQKYGVKQVLDCACGTGKHLYIVHKMGFDIVGSDYSSSMLDVCQKNLMKEGINIPLKQVDYRYLENTWNQKYDAVLCMTQAIAHMHTKDDLIKAMKSMYKRLNMNGILVMTQGTTHLTLQNQFRFSLVINNQDFSRLYVRDIEDGFQMVNILDIFHSTTKNEMKKHSMKLKILLDDDFKCLLKEAGFKKVELYGDYQMNSYQKDNSWKLIVVAQK